MTATTLAPGTLCGCGRDYASHYPDLGRMRGPGCPDFHEACDRSCKHPILRARTGVTVIQLAAHGPAANRDDLPPPARLVPARLREEPLPPADEEPDEPAPPAEPAPVQPAAPVAEAADDETPVGPDPREAALLLIGVLRKRRQDLGLSQAQVSLAIGAEGAKSHVSRTEAGRVMPTLVTFTAWAARLGLEVQLVPREVAS